MQMLIVSITDQMLYHRRRAGVRYAYPVSTAAAGIGNIRGSLKTPFGLHRIHTKIGEGMPIFTAFVGRKPIGVYHPSQDDPACDWILSRILWLEGIRTGENRRGHVDTKSRFIYIHGTHAENRLGTSASHGCVRMRNADIIELFEHTHIGEIVRIMH